MELTAAICFPGTRDVVFLDAACVSLFPLQAAAALQQLTQELLTCPARDASAHHIQLDQSADRPRREAARLIGANPADVALIESTTHGLQAVAATVPLHQGDKVLVGATRIFGAGGAVDSTASNLRFSLGGGAARDGRLLVEDFARAVDSHTRMILLSSVQWNNGFRADLAAFSNLARERNLILVVDAIQQLALCAGRGADAGGFHRNGRAQVAQCPRGSWFPVRASALAGATAAGGVGVFNICQPPEGWANYFATPTIPAVRDYDFHRDARAFEIGGTANYPGNVALGASLALINELGIDSITAYILDLTEELMEGLRSAATPVTPPERANRSGIVTFTLGKGVEGDTAGLQRLLDRRVLISQCYTAGIGGLRVGPLLQQSGGHRPIDRDRAGVGKAGDVMTKLGKTGLQVSRMGLGLAALGRPGYINLGHADDLAHDYDVTAMPQGRSPCWMPLGPQGFVISMWPVPMAVRRNSSATGSAMRDRSGYGRWFQVGLHLHGELARGGGTSRSQGTHFACAGAAIS